MQGGVFEAEHELSELRASLQSEQDGLERRAAGLADAANRQRRKEEQLEGQKKKLEAERQAWSDGSMGQSDAQIRLQEAQEATARLKVHLAGFCNCLAFHVLVAMR